MKESKLLDPSHSHPSPPTVFALSCTSELLLSASQFPPTIHITNLALNTPPFLLKPRCSSSPVVAANFHPEKLKIFLLAFADGTCALYNAAHLLWDGDKANGRMRPAGPGKDGEIAYVKRVHGMGNLVSASELPGNDPRPEATGSTAIVGDKFLGITAVGCIPGSESKAVTVGSDGKCCVLDFGVSDRKSRILDTWHIQSPATSLSLLPFSASDGLNPSGEQAQDAWENIASVGVLVAIGLQDGRIRLFDLHGHLLEELLIDSGGSRIIDVEWMNSKATTLPGCNKSSHRMQQVPFGKSKNKRLQLDLSGDLSDTGRIIHTAEAVPMHVDALQYKSRNQRIKERPVVEPILATSALNHMGFYSPEIQVSQFEAEEYKSSAENENSRNSDITITEIRRHSIYKPKNTIDRTESLVGGFKSPMRKYARKKNRYPVLPSRAKSRSASRASLRRAETIRLARPSTAESKEWLKGWKIQPGSPRPTKKPILGAPYVKATAISTPGGLPSPKVEASGSDLIASGTLLPEYPQDPWTDTVSKSPQHKRTTSRKNPAKHELNGHYPRSIIYHDSSSIESQLTNNTIIDWSAGVSQSRHAKPLIPYPLSMPTQKEASKGRRSASGPSQQLLNLGDSPPQLQSFKTHSIFKTRTDDPTSPRKIPSSNPSPKSRRPLPALIIQSLAEINHNSKTLLPSVSSKFPLPKVTPLEPLACACQETNIQLHALKEEMGRQFQAQRKWFEERMADLLHGRKGLEGENRALKAVLGRE